jgi:hypothetical protein
MKDYSSGKIYKLINDSNDDIYIGSTTQPLYKRLNNHKTGFNHFVEGKLLYIIKSFELFFDGNVSIILLENYSCNSKEQLLSRERYWIDTLKCVNKNRPIVLKEETKISVKQYYETNKEIKKKYDLNYRMKNREYYREQSKKQRDRKIITCININH